MTTSTPTTKILAIGTINDDPAFGDVPARCASELEYVQMLARSHTGAAFETLTEILRDQNVSVHMRRKAAAILHKRGLLGGN